MRNLLADLVRNLGKLSSQDPSADDRILAGKYVAISFAGRDLRDFVLSGEFIDCDFRNSDLRGATLRGTFIGVSFLHADMRGVDVEAATFTDCEAG